MAVKNGKFIVTTDPDRKVIMFHNILYDKNTDEILTVKEYRLTVEEARAISREFLLRADALEALLAKENV